MKQRNEKTNKTNSVNVIYPHKGGIDMNFEKIDNALIEGKTIYWCESIIYAKQLVSAQNIEIKGKTFLIVTEIKSETIKQFFICSFHALGYGFFLETEEFAESLQIYKATQDRDYFFIVNELIDKKNQNTKATEEVLNKKELDDYLMEYFEGIKSFFISSYEDSIVKGLFEFIK